MNYLLTQRDTRIPFRSPDAAIIMGQQSNHMFTVEMVEPNMIVCFWQPGMDKVAYNESYQRWYEAQQRELQQVMG